MFAGFEVDARRLRDCCAAIDAICESIEGVVTLLMSSVIMRIGLDASTVSRCQPQEHAGHWPNKAYVNNQTA
jgi:hypothetical protein